MKYINAATVVSVLVAFAIVGAVCYVACSKDIYNVDANGKPTTKSGTIKTSFFGPGAADKTAK